METFRKAGLDDYQIKLSLMSIYKKNKAKNKKMIFYSEFDKLHMSSNLNVKANEFIPSKKTKYSFLEKFLKDKLMFDNNEKDFIKNNEWLFNV